MDSLPKNKVWKGKSSNFTEEKPSKHSLNQVTKVTTPGDSLWPSYTLKGCNEEISPLVFFLKIHNPGLIIRKTSAKPRWKDTLKDTWPIFLKT